MLSKRLQKQGHSGLWKATSFKRHEWPQTKMHTICNTILGHILFRVLGQETTFSCVKILHQSIRNFHFKVFRANMMSEFVCILVCGHLCHWKDVKQSGVCYLCLLEEDDLFDLRLAFLLPPPQWTFLSLALCFFSHRDLEGMIPVSNSLPAWSKRFACHHSSSEAFVT